MIVTADAKEVILLKLALKDSVKFFHQFNVGNNIILKVEFPVQNLPKNWNKLIGSYIYE